MTRLRPFWFRNSNNVRFLICCKIGYFSKFFWLTAIEMKNMWMFEKGQVRSAYLIWFVTELCWTFSNEPALIRFWSISIERRVHVFLRRIFLPISNRISTEDLFSMEGISPQTTSKTIYAVETNGKTKIADSSIQRGFSVKFQVFVTSFSTNNPKFEKQTFLLKTIWNIFFRHNHFQWFKSTNLSRIRFHRLKITTDKVHHHLSVLN